MSGPNVFVTVTTWKPLYPGDPACTRTVSDTLAAAIQAGLSLSCLAGVLTVHVCEADIVHSTYDRCDNYWRSLTEAARAAALS